MNQVNILRRNGVFDSKAPRYTSYPPANRFELGVGARHQRAWMGAVSPAVPVSLYVHIPFCRRLCWFCACRTQGTKTLAPVEKYIDTLVREIAAVAGQHLPPGLRMGRLHLGGGTPTLLSEALMTRLLDALWSGFTRDEEFEFSVEIDPTDAAPEVLDAMMRRNLDRASIGVQDFEPRVQAAIGRVQSFEDTQAVVARLRQGGVRSLNIDLLYGLPYQTEDSLRHTLQHVIALRPDRLALYGYAHVPHISKRQVMIPDAALPGGVERFAMSQMARDHLVAEGFVDIGIDHFARPEDRLAVAARAGTLTRNFQGYTDDTCETLIGLG
ncbi:MAG: radical SAM protein, partial [Pseudomonadota bacterium]